MANLVVKDYVNQDGGVCESIINNIDDQWCNLIKKLNELSLYALSSHKTDQSADIIVNKLKSKLSNYVELSSINCSALKSIKAIEFLQLLVEKIITEIKFIYVNNLVMTDGVKSCNSTVLSSVIKDVYKASSNISKLFNFSRMSLSEETGISYVAERSIKSLLDDLKECCVMAYDLSLNKSDEAYASKLSKEASDIASKIVEQLTQCAGYIYFPNVSYSYICHIEQSLLLNKVKYLQERVDLLKLKVVHYVANMEKELSEDKENMLSEIAQVTKSV